MASFLLTDVRIFDGDTTIEKGNVLVENGKIAKVSTSTISFHGPTFSKPGHTLLPGLIDVHIHANSGNRIALPQCLRFGVTTACDMHNEFPNIQKLRKQVERGDCADLKTTSYAATVENGWPAFIVLSLSEEEETRAEVATWPKLKTPEDGRKYVQDRLKEKVDYIKLMHESGTFIGNKLNMPSIELQRSIINEAHKAGLKTVAHSTSLDDTIEILEAGVDGLAHTFVDRPPNERLIAAYKKNNAHCNPTLCALGSCTAQGQATQEAFAHDPRIEHLLGEHERHRMCQCMGFAQQHQIEHAYESVRQLKKAGITILCGCTSRCFGFVLNSVPASMRSLLTHTFRTADAAGPAVGTAWGLSLHHELSLFIKECGFTPEEALRSATSLPAQRFNFSDRGRIQEGLRADLTLVEGNPLQDISHTLNLRGVWTAGQLCSAYKDDFQN